MVRNFGLISERELDQCHKGLMGGMRESDRERVLCSAETRSQFDYWSTQREKERDIVRTQTIMFQITTLVAIDV